MQDSEHVEGALARGVASYIGKPYESQKLVKEVRRVLRRRSKPAPSATAQNP
jgi:DNA-binding response OmpR family regulator